MKYKSGERRRALEYEKAVLDFWKKDKTFEKSVSKDREKEVVFYDGPPFPTGKPHHGTVLVSFIKEFIEQLNSDGTNSLFISNLISAIENNFPTVHHLKFIGINDYDTSYQTISVRKTDLNTLTKEERRKYVPEILVIDSENIILSINTVE